jgi:hypothetical protein
MENDFFTYRKNRKIPPSALILCPFDSNRIVILNGTGAIGFGPLDRGSGNVCIFRPAGRKVFNLMSYIIFGNWD